MCVWVYPKIENEFKKLFTEKCEVLATEHQDTTFCYGQNNNSWYYIKRSNIKDAGVNDKVLFYFSYFMFKWVTTPIFYKH